MKIENHFLTGKPYIQKIDNIRGPIITPEVIVIHYAVTDSIGSTVAAQGARGYWAHLSIDGHSVGDGGYQVVQAMPFNNRGSHAGKSSYRGRSGVNAFSVGIEIANPGPLIEKGGELFTVWGSRWTGPYIAARHKSRSPANWNHWADYTDQEIDLCVEICHTLKNHYPSIVDVVGHDEIAPGRKFDPGPAFPMAWLRKKVFP